MSDIKTRSDLIGYVSSLWRATLEKEDFGMIGRDSSGKMEVSVQNELDDLVEHYEIASFLNGTDFDKRIRRAAVREFAMPYWEEEKLDTRVVIPNNSFIPKALRRICMLYKKGANRWITTEETTTTEATDTTEATTEVAIVQDDEKTAEFNAFFSEAEIAGSSIKWYNLSKYTGASAIRVQFDSDKGKIDFSISGPSQFRVLYDDNWNVEKYLFSTRATIDGVQQNVIEIYSIVDGFDHYMRDVDGERHEIEGDSVDFMPVVIMRNDADLPYGNPMSDLVDACIRWNYEELLKNVDETFCAVNVALYVNVGGGEKDDKGNYVDEVIQVNPMDVIVAPDVKEDDKDPAITFVSGEPHSEQLIANKLDTKNEALQNEGISSVFLTDSVGELSGRALKFHKEELIDIRDEDKTIYTDYDKSVMVMCSRVINTFENANLPEERISYAIDFVDELFDDIEPDKEYELDKKKWEDGILPTFDFMVKYNPDINTADEAEEIMRANIAQKESIQIAGFAKSIPEVETDEQDDLIEAAANGT